MIVASRPIGRTDLKESVYLRLDTSRSSWNVFLGSFVQPVSVIASISVLSFDALQQLQCFTLRNCQGLGYNCDPKAMFGIPAPFELAPHLRA